MSRSDSIVCRILLLGCGLLLAPTFMTAQGIRTAGPSVTLDNPSAEGFPVFRQTGATPVCVDVNDDLPVRKAVEVFRSDVHRLSGFVPRAACGKTDQQILVGSIGHSSLLDNLIEQGKLDVSAIRGHWEAAVIEVVEHPSPSVRRALVIAGSDDRGAAFALYDLSRAMGVSPWNWWADVPVTKHRSAYVAAERYLQQSPAVQYRGIFLNDEDWGLRPWAARTMDVSLHNIGPNTYKRVFELLLRLHANTLWPAMHPGSMPFHMVPENAREAEEWGIVMGSSHSEAMLRNNVGEWDEGRDGPWNYQTNRPAIRAYWDRSAQANGKYENIYTVGMRGQHDSGLQASGTEVEKARLLEQVMTDQREILSQRVNHNLARIPQVIWLYKESIDLYRAGMKVPDDVTLGWTDDNYGYLRQLPTKAEQQRSGGSALYYHVSYWGSPHDYLWLASTPLELMREELTKAWDHGVRRMWILNVGDLKPAEKEIDYFLQVAWQLPELRNHTQSGVLQRWFAENFPPKLASRMARVQEQYYHLNFIRRPEFMGFNGYTDEVRRTAFNPLAWGDQNRERLHAWDALERETADIRSSLPAKYRDAYFELLEYPVEASAAQNRKFLIADRSYVDHHAGHFNAVKRDAEQVSTAQNRIIALTGEYNHLINGKWNGMMSWHPRDRRVFELPETALELATAPQQLPDIWSRGEPGPQAFPSDGCSEVDHAVSLDAAYPSVLIEQGGHLWRRWKELGLSNGSIGIANPGVQESAAWLDSQEKEEPTVDSTSSLNYDFWVTAGGIAKVEIALLPTFPIDSEHRLRYAIALDGREPVTLDAAGPNAHGASLTDWNTNVLSNSLTQTLPLGMLTPGKHTLRLFYGDPGVVFQHLTILFPGAPPAYPFPPQTCVRKSITDGKG